MADLRLSKKELSFCECDCGEKVTRFTNRFISGYNARVQSISFGNPERREELARARREKWGYVFSDEHRKKLSDSHKGHIPWNKGKTGVYSDEIKKRISQTLTGRIGPNKGRKFSKKWRENIGKAQVGRKSPMKGKQHSEEAKVKISEAGKGRKHSEIWKENIKKTLADPKINVPRIKKIIESMNSPEVLIKISGPNGSNWRGGIQAEPYCDIWIDREYKQSILGRDNYQCQNFDCFGKSKRLVLHHIDYDKKNCHPWNLITLCNSCNCRANYNQEMWQSFYQGYIQRNNFGRE